MALVSVVMNCLNGERYLREAIDSVFSQTYDDWEIVFWDNASSDTSGAIAKSHGERIRYFFSDRTTTLGAARNGAFAQTRGEYIAILDVDDIWLPKKLETQLKLFERDPQLAFTYSNSRYFCESSDLGTHFDASIPERGDIFGALLSQCFISTETLIFRKSAIRDPQGAFDSDFTMVMDYDLTLRLAYEYKVDYHPDCLSKWRVHDASESSRKTLLVSQESRSMLAKLENDLVSMRDRYANETAVFKLKTDFQFGQEAWALGRVSEARSAFRNHIYTSRKAQFFYIWTWIYPFQFPLKTLRRLKRFIG